MTMFLVLARSEAFMDSAEALHDPIIRVSFVPFAFFVPTFPIPHPNYYSLLLYALTHPLTNTLTQRFHDIPLSPPSLLILIGGCFCFFTFNVCFQCLLSMFAFYLHPVLVPRRLWNRRISGRPQNPEHTSTAEGDLDLVLHGLWIGAGYTSISGFKLSLTLHFCQR